MKKGQIEMLIALENGDYVAGEKIIRLSPAKDRLRRAKDKYGMERTALYDKEDGCPRIALGNIEEIAELMTTVVPAQPGFFLAEPYDDPAEGLGCSKNPIIAWRL